MKIFKDNIFYKNYKNHIRFYTKNKELFAALVLLDKNTPQFVNAVQIENRVFFQNGLGSQYDKIFNLKNHYSGDLARAKEIWNSLKNKPTTGPKITIEKTFQGALKLSTIFNNQLITKQYFYYTKNEALADFNDFLEQQQF